jgi:hypothetical protein
MVVAGRGPLWLGGAEWSYKSATLRRVRQQCEVAKRGSPRTEFARRDRRTSAGLSGDELAMLVAPSLIASIPRLVIQGRVTTLTGQSESVCAVTETFELGPNRALLLVATGEVSGQSRTSDQTYFAKSK